MAAPTDVHGLSFSEFFEREHLRLRHSIYLLTGDRDEAEDLVQEALARASERRDRVRPRWRWKRSLVRLVRFAWDALLASCGCWFTHDVGGA